MTHFSHMRPVARSGVAALPLLVAVGAVITALSVALAATSYNDQLAARERTIGTAAYAYAEAGVQDALLKIANDKKYKCVPDDCYSVAFVSGGCGAGYPGCALISVSGGNGTPANPKVIVSTGRTGIHLRRIRTEVLFDNPGHGQIATTTWSEI